MHLSAWIKFFGLLNGYCILMIYLSFKMLKNWYNNNYKKIISKDALAIT